MGLKVSGSTDQVYRPGRVGEVGGGPCGVVGRCRQAEQNRILQVGKPDPER